MLDIVIPGNNEESLLTRARLMGSELILAYEFKNLREIKSKRADFPKNRLALSIKASKPKDLKLDSKVLKAVDIVIASSTNADMVRKIVENSNINLFINIATSTGRDHTHYRRSNFNQVLAKLAHNSRQAYCIDFNRILKVHGARRALLLGRIIQNIHFCKKYKVPVTIASFATTPLELRSMDNLAAFARVLGAKHTTLVDLAKKVRFRKSKQYVARGIKRV